MIPERIDVTAGSDGVVLAVHDHPKRWPLLTVELPEREARKLLDDLVRSLYPYVADETLAHLP